MVLRIRTDRETLTSQGLSTLLGSLPNNTAVTLKSIKAYRGHAFEGKRTVNPNQATSFIEALAKELDGELYLDDKTNQGVNIEHSTYFGFGITHEIDIAFIGHSGGPIKRLTASYK